MAARIDHGVTSGTFSLDGQTWPVENNVWVVGNDEERIALPELGYAASILA